MSIAGKCPRCGRGMREVDQHVTFGDGSGPRFTCSVKLRATWCPSSDCEEVVVTVIPRRPGKLDFGDYEPLLD